MIYFECNSGQLPISILFGNGQLTRVAFKINDFLWNPHIRCKWPACSKNLERHLWEVSYTLHFIIRNSRVVLFLDSFVTFFCFHGFCTLTSNEPIACTRSESIFKSCLKGRKKATFGTDFQIMSDISLFWIVFAK